MELIADTLMVAGSFGAGIYCYVLSLRLKSFSTLEGGMGTAIAVLSGQVDDMTKALESARRTAGGSAANLEALTQRSEAVAARLELLLASMHDIPDSTTALDETQDRRLRFVRRRPSREQVETAE